MAHVSDLIEKINLLESKHTDITTPEECLKSKLLNELLQLKKILKNWTVDHIENNEYFQNNSDSLYTTLIELEKIEIPNTLTNDTEVESYIMNIYNFIKMMGTQKRPSISPKYVYEENPITSQATAIIVGNDPAEARKAGHLLMRVPKDTSPETQKFLDDLMMQYPKANPK